MNARDNAPTLPAIDGTINAAHGLLMTATDALSADQVAAMLKITKKAATVQLKELQGLGLLENEPRKGGTMHFRLAVVAKAEVCESVQTGGESQTDNSPISGELRAQMQSLNTVAPDEFSLLNVIADIRHAIGDDEGRIMLTGLAEHITCRMLERNVNGSTVTHALVDVADYLPDSTYRLRDGIRTMDMLIDAHRDYISAQEGRIANLSAIANSADSRINSLVSDVTNTRRALNDALSQADRMRTELIIERQAQDVLRRLIKASPAAAAKGYILKTPKQAMRRFGKEAAAQSAAMAAARAGKSGEVFALVPVGKAVRGAEWKVA